MVEPPSIDGETVVFRWTQTEPNPYQYENSFYLRYEGIDLARFAPPFFFEIFLGLQLKVFAAYGEPVEVVFPEPVPATTVAFWRTYHEAEHVTIGPIAPVASYSPWRSGRAPEPGRKSIGVLFGGGKDSNLATCLLAERYGADEIVLFQLVSPFEPNADVAERLEQRQEGLMLGPAREALGVATQRAWTDYLTQQHRCGFKVRPHLELYTVGLLPLALVWGVSLLSTSIAWTTYPIRRLADGEVWFRFPKSRPESLATQSTHYRRVIGADVTLTNTTLHFSTLTSYRVLATRYPEAFARAVMCVRGRVGRRWCYQCPKCADYARFGLACGMVDPRFDYDRLYAQSRPVLELVHYVESGVERSVFGNVPWKRVVSERIRYLLDCHAYALISPGLIADRLGTEALTNLLLLKAALGNSTFPGFESAPSQIADLLGHESAHWVAGIAAQYLDVVDVLPGPFLPDDPRFDYDFSIRMPTETELLDHIRGVEHEQRRHRTLASASTGG
ncbi:MAG TPA: hypothetical protein VH482_13575 [Thermomicrobiales bacterium]